MTPLERIKPEVLAKITEAMSEYPTTLADTLEQLKNRDAWTRLDYIVAMDIQYYSGNDCIGDCFYTVNEVLEMREAKKSTDYAE